MTPLLCLVIHNFVNSFAVGKIGEEQVLTYLKSQGEVTDVRDDSEYRKKDIDFILYKDGKPVFVEIKSEAKAAQTKNFFFEIVSNSNSKSPGCFLYSEADYWMVLVPQSSTLYSFPLKELRSYVVLNQSAYKSITVANKGYNTIGVIAPIKDICANVKNEIIILN